MAFIKTKNKKIKLPPNINLFKQTYITTTKIDDVLVLKTNCYPDDFGGWFKEVLRLDQGGRVVPLLDNNIIFKPLQTNTSFITPKAKRFWHIHPNQNEIWTTSSTLLVGLIDFRPDSKTYGAKMKVILSNDKLLYIPSGVAHGFINPSNVSIALNYYTDQYFASDSTTQEYRINPKKISYKFVMSELM